MDEQQLIAQSTVEFEPLWAPRDVQQFLKLSGRTVDRLVAAGQFPAPIRVGCSKRWKARDVVRFVEQQG